MIPNTIHFMYLFAYRRIEEEFAFALAFAFAFAFAFALAFEYYNHNQKRLYFIKQWTQSKNKKAKCRNNRKYSCRTGTTLNSAFHRS